LIPALKDDGTAKPARKGRKQRIFEVEKIIDYKLDKKTGAELYLVKWVDYSNSDNTWEPLENLTGCKDELSSFLASLGKDKKEKKKKSKKA
jgi:hypothetical protein